MLLILAHFALGFRPKVHDQVKAVKQTLASCMVHEAHIWPMSVRLFLPKALHKMHLVVHSRDYCEKQQKMM
jgi:hypothetical protein